MAGKDPYLTRLVRIRGLWATITMGLGQFPQTTLVLASMSVALVQSFAPVGTGLHTPHQTGVVFSLLTYASVLCPPWQPGCTGAGELEAQGLEVGSQCSPGTGQGCCPL